MSFVEFLQCAGRRGQPLTSTRVKGFTPRHRSLGPGVLPNDGISFPEAGRQLISYMSVENWNSAGPAGPQWKSRYAGLAYSDNGNDFICTPLKWWNSPDNASRRCAA